MRTFTDTASVPPSLFTALEPIIAPQSSFANLWIMISMVSFLSVSENLSENESVEVGIIVKARMAIVSMFFKSKLSLLDFQSSSGMLVFHQIGERAKTVTVPTQSFVVLSIFTSVLQFLNGARSDCVEA